CIKPTKNRLSGAGQAQPIQQFGHAVVVAVLFRDDVCQGLDGGHPVGHDGGDAGGFQHPAVVFAVADGQHALPGDPQMGGQRQQGRALVDAGGGGLDVVGGALGGFYAGNGGQKGQGGLGFLAGGEEHAGLLDISGVGFKIGVKVGQDGEPSVVGLFGLGGEEPGDP